MQLEEIKEYCIHKWKAYEDHPFGDIPICYKLNKKVFAQIYPKKEDYKVTLKCSADFGQFYRQVYPEVVVRGYHCPPVQQPYWNTVYPDKLTDEELLNMIDHAYDTVLHSFSKKAQKEILEVVGLEIRPMNTEEYPLLEDFLYEAIYQPGDCQSLPREVIYKPELEIYFRDFGKPDDICLVAEAEGNLLGAVFTRIMEGEKKGYGYLDEFTPELAISVKKEFHSQGIGTRLMQEMIAVLRKRGYKHVSLSVDKENRACRMYQTLGFSVVKERDSKYFMKFDLN